MLAHATRQDGRPSATDSPGEAPSATLALTFLRWLDLIVIVAAAPFVLISSLPSAGFAIGAGTWLAARLVVTHVERRAWSATDTRVRAALHLTAILGRVWFIALGVLIARFAIGTPTASPRRYGARRLHDRADDEAHHPRPARRAATAESRVSTKKKVCPRLRDLHRRDGRDHPAFGWKGHKYSLHAAGRVQAPQVGRPRPAVDQQGRHVPRSSPAF